MIDTVCQDTHCPCVQHHQPDPDRLREVGLLPETFTPRECEFLLALLPEGRTVRAQEILRRVYGSPHWLSRNILRTNLHRIRGKLPAGVTIQYVGHGYRLQRMGRG